MVHDDTPPRTAALRDLRAADAARVLGVLDPTGLTARAREWHAQGVTSPAVRALAAGGTTAGPAVLLATAAAELGVSVPDEATARVVQARAVIAVTARGGDAGQALFALSNSVTDGITGRLRARWRRRTDRR